MKKSNFLIQFRIYFNRGVCKLRIKMRQIANKMKYLFGGRKYPVLLIIVTTLINKGFSISENYVNSMINDKTQQAYLVEQRRREDAINQPSWAISENEGGENVGDLTIKCTGGVVRYAKLKVEDGYKIEVLDEHYQKIGTIILIKDMEPEIVMYDYENNTFTVQSNAESEPVDLWSAAINETLNEAGCKGFVNCTRYFNITYRDYKQDMNEKKLILDKRNGALCDMNEDGELYCPIYLRSGNFTENMIAGLVEQGIEKLKNPVQQVVSKDKTNVWSKIRQFYMAIFPIFALNIPYSFVRTSESSKSILQRDFPLV